VTHEVLPSIRRTGGYCMSGRQQKSARKEWVLEVNATCRAIDAIRRSQGSRAAAAVCPELFAKIGIGVPSEVDQPELDLKVVGGTDTETP
jgi:prophage antirepressor-like protein